MRSVMIIVGIVYFLLVANFYNESHGFTKFYNEMYPVWKITPIVFLIIFSLLHGGGLYIRDRFICALGLLFGGIGDYLIGISHEGIITGAVAFGIGHFIYMTFFIHHHTILCWPLLVAMLLWGALVGHVCVFPLLAEQPIAVGIMTVYSLILSTCFFISASQYINQPPTKRNQGLCFRMLGFLLFYVSDSVLILSHTGRRLPFSEIIILSTYYSAQYLILQGNIASTTAVKFKIN